MRVSYSRVGTFNKCPYQFKLKYIDKLETFPNWDDPGNALILGHALHTGIEKDTCAAINEYYYAFPIISDLHEIEAMKLEYRIKQCKKILPEGIHELEIADGDDFIGFIDLLVPVGTDEKGIQWFDLYDFKYSNNVKNYLESEQLHIYKWYFEKLNPNKRIRNLYYLFVPKVNIRLKKTENVDEFRLRTKAELKEKSPEIVQVEYDIDKVKDFLRSAKQCRTETKFEKSPSRLCNWCDFKKYCESNGKETLDIMNLPKNERISLSDVTNRKIWIYGLPFSGKTYLANSFPDMLLLSTDGNYKQLPDGIPPHIDIKDVVKVTGRLTERTLAWDVFKDTISELEKKQNDFKTIVVDLLEDTYEYCRLYCYDKLDIEHESDNSFKAWDYVRTEFLSTIKRLMNLDYENIILISHEDTSKDMTRKSGDKITAIKPNLQEKTALKIAGMVDMVVRVINDEGDRKISFKTSEVIFGGGRLTVDAKEIPCQYEALINVYSQAKPKESDKPVETKKPRAVKKSEPKEEPKEEPVSEENPVVEPPFELTEVDLPFDTGNIPTAPPVMPEVETADATPTPRRRSRRVRS